MEERKQKQQKKCSLDRQVMDGHVLPVSSVCRVYACLCMPMSVLYTYLLTYVHRVEMIPLL